MNAVRLSWRVGCGLLLLFTFASARGASIDLRGYSLASGPIGISGVSDNLSGVTYSPVSGTLFGILNGPETIVEMQTDGTVVREISLTNGIDDTEAIVHLGGTQFAIVEERARNFMVVDLAPGVTSIDYQSLSVIPLAVSGAGDNVGLEGLAYDSITDTIYVAKEFNAPTVYSFSLSSALATPTPPPLSVSSPFSVAASGLVDLSGLHFDATTGNLLIVSHESNALIEVATTGPNAGQELSRLSLSGIAQAEGVTLGPDGAIYIVGEPDEFFVFTNDDVGVPEPATGLLLITGFGAAMMRRCRKRPTS